MEKVLVITFKNTSSAMNMEKVCKRENLKGELIAIPKELEAGCGLSRKADLKDRARLKSLMDKEKIAYDQIVDIYL